MFILDLYKAPLRSFRFIYYSIHRSTLSPPNAVRPRYFLSLWFLLTHRFIYIWKYKIKYMFGSWHFGNKTGLRTPQGPAFPQKGLFFDQLDFCSARGRANHSIRRSEQFTVLSGLNTRRYNGMTTMKASGAYSTSAASIWSTRCSRPPIWVAYLGGTRAQSEGLVYLMWVYGAYD